MKIVILSQYTKWIPFEGIFFVYYYVRGEQIDESSFISRWLWNANQ